VGKGTKTGLTEGENPMSLDRPAKVLMVASATKQVLSQIADPENLTGKDAHAGES